MLSGQAVRCGYLAVQKQARRTRLIGKLCNEAFRNYCSLQSARVTGNAALQRIESRLVTDLREFRSCHSSPATESKTVKVFANSDQYEEVAEPELERSDKTQWRDNKPSYRSSGSRFYPRSNGPAVEKVSWTESSDVPDAVTGAFSNYRLSEPVIKKLQEQGIQFLFPVQTSTFNHIYEGEDVIVQARTGSGKTLSYVIPLLEKLLNQSDATSRNQRRRSPQLLVMTPTRELARQVTDVIEKFTSSISVACVYGGAAIGPQESRLRSGVDVVVGTPGRIQDMLDRGALDLSTLNHVVLDEVDRMLDMGFADDVDNILKHRYVYGRPEENPQTLLFSATVPSWVQKTARKYLSEDLVKLDLVGSGTVRTATTVEHLSVCCPANQRTYVIADMLKVYSGSHGRAIVFCETKREADNLAVSKSMRDETHVLHGDVPQSKREMVLKGFREGRYKVLIATDVAARGLDIADVDLVIQCCPPKDVESYIHRSGRTGRAGRSGVSVLLYQPHERYDLEDVQRKAGIKFKTVAPPKAADIALAAAEDAVKSLENIPDSVAEKFKKIALTLVEKHGAVEALSAALAVVSGAGDEPERSLITNRPDFTTYIYRSPLPLRKLGAAYYSLEENIPEYNRIRENMSNMRLLADNMGCVFDLPSELNDSVKMICCSTDNFNLQRATDLPEIIEPPRYNSSQGGFQRRGGGFSSSRGGDRGGYMGGSRSGSFKSDERPWNKKSEFSQRSEFNSQRYPTSRSSQRRGLIDDDSD